MFVFIIGLVFMDTQCAETAFMYMTVAMGTHRGLLLIRFSLALARVSDRPSCVLHFGCLYLY